MMRYIRPVLLAVTLPLLQGCIMPHPGTDYFSDKYSGRLIDASTRAPIPGARIQIEGFPSTATCSRKDGTFNVGPARFVHLFDVGWDPVEKWPRPPSMEGVATIRISDGSFLQTNLVRSFTIFNMRPVVDLGDIALERSR
jgi:hypothetical protein